MKKKTALLLPLCLLVAAVVVDGLMEVMAATVITVEVEVQEPIHQARLLQLKVVMEALMAAEVEQPQEFRVQVARMVERAVQDISLFLPLREQIPLH